MQSSDETEYVYAWLRRARAESLLKGGQRRYDLLEYLVREELEGRGDALKAYAIALDVLGRGEDFDPATDSIVRVEVARLRDSLALYYARSDDPSEPKISIPKGSYRPSISVVSAVAQPGPDASDEPAPRKGRGLAASTALVVAALCGLAFLFLVRFVSPAPNTDKPVVEIASIAVEQTAPGYQFAEGFRQQLLADLAHLPTVTVRNGPLAPDDLRSGVAPEPDYRLTVTPAFQGRSGIVGLELSSTTTATVVWTRAVPIPDSTADFYMLLTDAVRGIGQEVAGASGVITNEQAQIALSAMEDRGTPRGEYPCLILSLVFDATKDQDTGALSRACLAETVAGGTENSTLLALFALDIFFESSGVPSQESQRLLQDARDVALNAVQANPFDAFAHEVLGNVLSALGDREGAIERYQRAVELAPSRPAPHFLLGWQMALQGNWDDGVVRMQEGIDMQPIVPGYMIVPLALDAFRRSDYAQSLQFAQAIIDRGDARGFSLAFAASVALGDSGRAEAFFIDPRARTSSDPVDPMREVRVTFSNPDVMPLYERVIEPFLAQIKTR